MIIKEYIIRREVFNESEKYMAIIFKQNLKEKTIKKSEEFKGKTLNELLEKLIENKHILDSDEKDILSTIAMPSICENKQTIPLNLNELLNFYIKFKSKSYEYTKNGNLNKNA